MSIISSLTLRSVSLPVVIALLIDCWFFFFSCETSQLYTTLTFFFQLRNIATVYDTYATTDSTAEPLLAYRAINLLANIIMYI